MRRFLQVIGVVVFIALAMLSVSCEVSLWKECRQRHGFVYCYRLLESK